VPITEDDLVIPQENEKEKPKELDLDELAKKIAELIPKAKDGQDGLNGQPGSSGLPGLPGENGIDGSRGLQGEPGRGIQSLTVDPSGNLVVRYTDETTQVIANFGLSFELYDKNGDKVDNEFIPIGGALRLQKYVGGQTDAR